MACRQLEELKQEELNREKEKGSGQVPFMMRVDFWGPHQPYCPTEEFAALYPPESIEEYPALLMIWLENRNPIVRYRKGNEPGKALIRPNPMEWSRWQKILSRCYGQITMVDEAAGRVIEKLGSFIWMRIL